jgi:hypothetical protein
VSEPELQEMPQNMQNISECRKLSQKISQNRCISDMCGRMPQNISEDGQTRCRLNYIEMPQNISEAKAAEYTTEGRPQNITEDWSKQVRAQSFRYV